MTLQTLIEELQTLADAFGDETEVRLMTQQSYPFEQSISGIASLEDIHGYDGGKFKPAPSRGWNDASERPRDVIYLLEGNQLGYGTADAWEA